MTIKQYTPGMTIEVGKWVTMDSYMRGCIAGRAAEVAAVTEKMVSVRELETWRREEQLGAPRRHRSTSVTFVCDTKEEAISVREAAVAEMDVQLKIERERKKEDDARRAVVVAGILAWRPA